LRYKTLKIIFIPRKYIMHEYQMKFEK